VDKDDVDRRLTEASLEPFVASVEDFLAGMAETMGAVPFRDTKNSVHLSGPGWGALGVIFHDLEATLGRTDLAELGRKVGEIDWQREAEFWSDVMREKEVRGKTVITFIGGGYESRQAIRRKVHQHLGTWEELQRALEPNAVVEAGATLFTGEVAADAEVV
jgi:hypothetical protein